MDTAFSRDKVRGMFLGVAIGDALGMPVETWPPERIARQYGRITIYLPPPAERRRAATLSAGSTTDDTQLTLAVARALIRGNGEVNMDLMAEEHVRAFREGTVSWGSTTREAVERLADGVHWRDSGWTKKANCGTSNGAVMKLSPLAVVLAHPLTSFARHEQLLHTLGELTLMTHRTAVACSASGVHVLALAALLVTPTSDFSPLSFGLGAQLTSLASPPCVLSVEGRELLWARLRKFMQNVCWEELSVSEVINRFGRGSRLIADSLPFSYAFFLRAPHSIEALYDVVNAGGDTDTNGSIVGSLLGALNGTAIFPQHLVDGLRGRDEVLTTADQLCDVLKVPD